MTKKKQANSWQEKKSKFQQKEESSKKIRRIAGGAVLLMGIAAIVFVMFSGGSEGGANAAKSVASSAPGQDIRIPLAEVSDGQAKFYSYTVANGQKVRFFAIKSSDGVIRAALDACVVCYKSQRGYHQQGDDMICNNCQRHFRSANVNVITGGCNPIPLTRSVEGDNLVIKAGDLQQGAVYF